MNKKQDLKKSKFRKSRSRSTLTMTFILSLMLIISFAMIITIVFVLLKYGYKIEINIFKEVSKNTLFGLIIFSCVIVGYALTLLLSKGIMSPVEKTSEAMDELARGNYQTRLNFKIPLQLFGDITYSFNKMATELEHTETLSNDFINNFSHEFKTPIASIEGFARLLRKGNLTEEQQNEYLTIIEDESKRLTGMATSVLKLMKIENQSILTDVKKFNLSEQIRNCVLLLEDKWVSKNLNIEIEFDEFFISGNEELLKEVWINLFDNAIKYTPENGTIRFDIKMKEENVVVALTNTGSEIPAEHQLRIFNKFYQADSSHSSQGNGVGLAIVKKVVSLHNGEVYVVSGNKKTMFVVNLPTVI